MDDEIADEIFSRSLYFARPAKLALGLHSSKNWDVFDPEMQLDYCRRGQESSS